MLRDVNEAWPSVSPALSLWLLVAGVALGATPGALTAWTRDLRFSAPRQTLVLSAAALATVLTTCVASTVQGPLPRSMGVDHAQGFHLGEPAPLSDWLSEADAVALS